MSSEYTNSTNAIFLRLEALQKKISTQSNPTSRATSGPLQYTHRSRVPYIRASGTLLPIVGGVFGVHERHQFDINWRLADERNTDTRAFELNLKPTQFTDIDGVAFQPTVGAPLLVSRENPFPPLPVPISGHDSLLTLFDVSSNPDQDHSITMIGENNGIRVPLQLGELVVSKYVNVVLDITESKLS